MEKKSNDYWIARAEALEAAQNQKGNKYYAGLKKQYKKAASEVQKDIETWYSRFAINNQITLQEARKLLNKNELEEFHWNVLQYIEKGRENAISHQWEKQLENASAKWHISRLEALKIQMQNHVEQLYDGQQLSMADFLVDVYTDNYYHTAYEIQKGFNVGYDLMRLDRDKIEKVVSKPWAADGSNFSDRIWKHKAQLVSELHNGLTQSIIRGQDSKALIEHISKRFEVSEGQAARLVMTETSFVQSASTRDSYKELDVEEYEIVATLDRKTSELCRGMDGKHFPLSQYEIGATAPPFHVWCRTTTVPFFDDEFELDAERAARADDGSTYFVPASMKYPEWKEKFVDGGSKEGLKVLTAVETAAMVKQGIEKTVVPEEAQPSIEHANEIATKALEEQYTHRIDDLGLDYIPLNDETKHTVVKADFEGMDARLAEASAEQFAKLSSEYENMAFKISVDKFDAMMGSVPAATDVQMHLSQASMSFNKNVVKDYDKFTERMKSAVERGQFPDMSAADYDKYVMTHEFAHTMFDFDSPLKNYVKADTKHIKAARKEIKEIRDDYNELIRDLTVRQKEAELEAITSFDESAWKKAQELTEELKKATISNYADMSIDEFMAEAFTDAKIGSNPTEHSKRVLAVIDKYFNKETLAKTTKSSIIKVKNSELPNGLPISGTANSIVDKVDDAGATLQRRKYGSDGKAAVDYDTTDHNLPNAHPTGAHKHEFDYSKKRPRKAPEPLTKEELEENEDIIKKGVNYHDEE